MTPSIGDLDEFEDLTAEMVRAWLRAKGCVFDGTWSHPERPKAYYWDSQLLGGALPFIAYDFGLSLQALLREINPRMRRGRPSQAERDTHEGLWLASLPGSRVLLVGTFSDDGETFFPWLAAPMRNTCEGAQDWMDAWSFWPCDQHGNKVFRGPARKRESESGK